MRLIIAGVLALCLTVGNCGRIEIVSGVAVSGSSDPNFGPEKAFDDSDGARKSNGDCYVSQSGVEKAGIKIQLEGLSSVEKIQLLRQKKEDGVASSLEGVELWICNGADCQSDKRCGAQGIMKKERQPGKYADQACDPPIEGDSIFIIARDIATRGELVICDIRVKGDLLWDDEDDDEDDDDSPRGDGPGDNSWHGDWEPKDVYFSNEARERDAAAADCYNRGMRLATPQSHAELKALGADMYQNNPNLWVGWGRANGDVQQFTDAYGNTAPFDYAWTQPSRGWAELQACRFGGDLHDCNYWDTYYYVCQKGDFESNGNFYSPIKRDLNGAKADCANRGMRLPTPADAAELSALGTELWVEKDRKTWLGWSRVSNDAAWTNSLGAGMPAISWAWNEPGWNELGACRYNGELHGCGSGDQYLYICVSDAGIGRPSSYHAVQTFDYDGAKSDCSNRGMQLATPSDVAELGSLGSSVYLDSPNLWLGWSRFDSKGIFKDVAGNDMATSIQWAWAQPSSWGDELGVCRFNNEMHDCNFGDQYRYICVPSSVKSSVYYSLRKQNRNFARMECEQRGLTLPTPQSNAEMIALAEDFIVRTRDLNMWLGYSRANSGVQVFSDDDGNAVPSGMTWGWWQPSKGGNELQVCRFNSELHDCNWTDAIWYICVDEDEEDEDNERRTANRIIGKIQQFKKRTPAFPGK